jgi:hypothetical protein
MTDLLSTELIDDESELHPGRGMRRREAQTARACGAGATVSIQPEEFRAELACGCPQAGAEREPYEEGFAAYASGAGLADNPYHGDNCAHQQWANGWSQARDEAQRQARQ